MEKINVKKINKKIEKKKTKTKFVPGFLLGMFAMLVLGVAVGVGLHFSQDSVKTDATYGSNQDIIFDVCGSGSFVNRFI